MKQNHIIHKVSIEVAVKNKEKAYLIKDNINSFLTVDVFPKLEKYIDTLDDTLPAHTIQISRVTLELNESEASLNTDLRDHIVKQFKKELTETIKPALKPDYDPENEEQVSLWSEQDKLLQTFIHFLEKGHMPWWSSNENAINILESEMFKKIISAKTFENRVSYIIQKPSVRERIINQLTNTQIKQLVLTIIKNKNLKINLEAANVKQLSQLTLIDRNVIWSLILDILKQYSGKSDANLEEYTLQQILKTLPLLRITRDHTNEAQTWKEIIKIFPFIKQDQGIASVKNTTLEKNQENVQQPTQTNSFLPSDKDAQNDTVLEENKGHYVQNAGLVLIHPFIKNLFLHCDLIDTKTQELINPELCVHLLHYIATGKTNQPESDMLFEKFLCNIPLHQSISRHVKLSSKHKVQAKKVIEAVQQNWSSMKTSSVGLLQNEFFQRPGKLVLNDNKQTLTIERKTQDVLMEKLSWGIGFIKLPWQKEFIYVNW
jgi:hypothetical protein